MTFLMYVPAFHAVTLGIGDWLMAAIPIALVAVVTIVGLVLDRPVTTATEQMPTELPKAA
jgi:hypothetical protein